MSKIPFTQETVSGLSKQSQQIFSIFTQTQKRLEAVNGKVNTLLTQRKAEAQKLLNEAAELEGIIINNTKLHDKISSFVNS